MCVPRSGKVKRVKIEKITKSKAAKPLINQVKYRNLAYESTFIKSKEETQAAQ